MRPATIPASRVESARSSPPYSTCTLAGLGVVHAQIIGSKVAISVLAVLVAATCWPLAAGG